MIKRLTKIFGKPKPKDKQKQPLNESTAFRAAIQEVLRVHARKTHEKPTKATNVLPDVMQVKAAKTVEIEIFARNVKNNEFRKVLGLLDTGANRNVGSLAKLRNFCKRLEQPRRVTQVQFPDKFSKPVKFVGRLDLELRQGNTVLALGEQVVFLIEDPN